MPLKSGACATASTSRRIESRAAALDRPALVHRDRAEGAAAEAAAHDLHRVADRLPGRGRRGVVGVRPPRVGQLVETIHRRLVERRRRRVEDDDAVAVGLGHEAPRVPRVRLVMQHAGHLGEGDRVVLDTVSKDGQRERVRRSRPSASGRVLVLAEQVGHARQSRSDSIQGLRRGRGAGRSRGSSTRPCRSRAGPPSTSRDSTARPGRSSSRSGRCAGGRPRRRR